MLNIVAISGSLREKSFNTALLRACEQLSPEPINMETMDISDFPLFNQDLEANGTPAPVQRVKDKVLASDALLISSPEYNHGVTGPLKNAIDWLTRPPEDMAKVFHHRPCGMIGAAAGRTATAYAQTCWLPTLTYLNLHLYHGKSLLVGGAFNLFDDEGNLTDETTQGFVKEYMEGFVDFVTSSNYSG